MMLWDFQNKGKSGWTGKSSFVLKVPPRYLRPSIIYSVPCDRTLQRAYAINTKVLASTVFSSQPLIAKLGQQFQHFRVV